MEDHIEKRIFFTAFIIRLIMLIIIICIPNDGKKAFKAPDIYYDDFRYEEGASLYSIAASKAIDYDAFTEAYISVDDWIGYNFVKNPFIHTPLWYWFVCVLMYWTKSYISIRIANIVFASIAVIYVYKFTEINWGIEVASRATKMLTFLPYPIIFSCFGYKDQFIMMSTFFLLYHACLYRDTQEISLREIVLVLVMGICTLFTRGGLSAILFAICMVIAFGGRISFEFSVKSLILQLIVFLMVFLAFIKSIDTIIYKINYYLERHASTSGQGSGIAFVTIAGLKDIYKLPLAYLFSIIMPINLFDGITSWYDVVSNLNILMTPIAVGAGAYFFVRKQANSIYIMCLIYYLICIIASINNFRHYYSLSPLSLIFFSDYIETKQFNGRIIVTFGALVYSAALLLFYFMKHF